MKIAYATVCLFLALLLSAQEPPQPKPDPLVRLWDVECQPKGCLMFLDIGHGDQGQPDFLTITVAINKGKKDVAFISFIIPDKADRTKGLAIGFADSEKDVTGKWTMKMVEGTARVLECEGCKDGECKARVKAGVIPATAESGELNLLDQFLNHRMLVFFYWVKGERVRAATTLSGFQDQYPKVLQEKMN